jgi:hypothetical protein
MLPARRRGGYATPTWSSVPSSGRTDIQQPTPAAHGRLRPADRDRSIGPCGPSTSPATSRFQLRGRSRAAKGSKAGTRSGAGRFGWARQARGGSEKTPIALSRGHHNCVAIFTLNALLGWTVFGWLGAFVWSLTAIMRIVPARRR